MEVYFAEEALKALEENMGKHVVEGRMVYGTVGDGKEGWKFVPYDRKPRVRRKDMVVRHLPNGWIRMSRHRLKVFSTASGLLDFEGAVATLKRDIGEGLDASLLDGSLEHVKTLMAEKAEEDAE